MKVVVTSDQHLGYANSDKNAFNAFLDHLAQDSEATHLVLLGDVVDMWRRDASGVFLENDDTMRKVLALKGKLEVYYVAGNHDYHALELQDHSYPFQFQKDLTLRDGRTRYRFVHGYEFDPEQDAIWMEALCRVMSDEIGSFESGFWAQLTRAWSNAKYVLYEIFLFWRKSGTQTRMERLQLTPEARLEKTFGQVESRACASVKPNEILVFGHTHRPFVNKAENVVNSGSWVTDSPIHNTFVELSNGKARLFVFGGQEITERKEC
jgi:UDP-2,3-diacylglucosamine pyrophosphatase LpxH